jgi:Predicted membrane protein
MVNVNDLMGKYREAILYVICGGFTTLVTWLTYAIFVWLGIEINISNILSWTCGITFAFVVNKWIVFNKRSLEKTTVIKEFTSFLGSRIFTGIIAFVLFPVLFSIGLDQSIYGIDGFLAKIVVSVIEIALNWIFSKYYVFRQRSTNPTS